MDSVTAAEEHGLAPHQGCGSVPAPGIGENLVAPSPGSPIDEWPEVLVLMSPEELAVLVQGMESHRRVNVEDALLECDASGNLTLELSVPEQLSVKSESVESLTSCEIDGAFAKGRLAEDPTPGLELPPNLGRRCCRGREEYQ